MASGKTAVFHKRNVLMLIPVKILEGKVNAEGILFQTFLTSITNSKDEIQAKRYFRFKFVLFTRNLFIVDRGFNLPSLSVRLWIRGAFPTEFSNSNFTQ